MIREMVEIGALKRVQRGGMKAIMVRWDLKNGKR
jgi:hypothetical protein